MPELITERIRRNARELRLYGIADDPDEPIGRAEQAKLGYREFLDLVLESEVGVLEGRRYASRLKMAGLPHHKTLDEFDVSFQPELDPKRIAELRSLRFIERKVGCLIVGPPGVGKSHLSVGLAMEALARGYLVRSTTLDDLVRGLRQADALGKLASKLAQLQRPHLLVIDEAGSVPLERSDANRVFQVVNRRYLRASTIITSNKPSANGPTPSATRHSPQRSSTASSTTPKSSPSTGPATGSRAASSSCAVTPPSARRAANDGYQESRRPLARPQIASHGLNASASIAARAARRPFRPRTAGYG